MIQAQNFIAGAWTKAANASKDINPSNTGDVVGEFPQGSAADAESAIAAAKAAFPGWSRSTVQQRHDVLKKIGDEIIARKDELGRLLSREEGKTLVEGIGETVRAGQIFLFFAGECLRLSGEIAKHLAEVTIHVSLRRAIEGVTFDAVLETLRIAHAASARWGQPAPRIAVAGLNPHAGEGGLFGDEEIRIIAPAIAAARAEGIAASGPYAPDTVFMRARHAPPMHLGEFDIVIAMTHDHGLIPVKYLGVEQGVNVTLGLPFVRTSPDHGTAFDLAGSGRADASSLAAAVRMARRLLVGVSASSVPP